MKMAERIKRLIIVLKKSRAVKKFKKECFHLPCTICPMFIDNDKYGKCRLTIELGLEEE